jgi:hypothetical protein
LDFVRDDVRDLVSYLRRDTDLDKRLGEVVLVDSLLGLRTIFRRMEPMARASLQERHLKKSFGYLCHLAEVLIFRWFGMEMGDDVGKSFYPELRQPLAWGRGHAHVLHKGLASFP